MKVALFTRGDAIFGMGHVFRCLAITKALSKTFKNSEITFIIEDAEPGVSVVKKGHSGTVIVVPPASRSSKALWLSEKWDILIIDQLSMPKTFLASCRKRASCLVVFDDVEEGRWLSDIAVNALYKNDVCRPDNVSTKNLCGFDYLVLDPKFADVAKHSAGAVSRILLTQGGSDTYGLIPELARSLGELISTYPDLSLDIHTGPAFRFEAELREAIASSTADIQWHSNIADMATFCSSIDLAVAAGGIMACELAAVGIPLVLITGEEQELETMTALAEAGAAVNLGDFGAEGAIQTQLSVKHLIPDIARRGAMSRAGRSAVDGLGGDRIVEAIRVELEGQIG